MEVLSGQMSTIMDKLETIGAMPVPSPVTKRKTKPTRARHARKKDGDGEEGKPISREPPFPMIRLTTRRLNLFACLKAAA